MSKGNIIKAWKNREFRQSLSEAEHAALPANPAGATMLNGNELDQVSGGMIPSTARCSVMCPTYIFICTGVCKPGAAI